MFNILLLNIVFYWFYEKLHLFQISNLVNLFCFHYQRLFWKKLIMLFSFLLIFLSFFKKNFSQTKDISIFLNVCKKMLSLVVLTL